jgi:MFS family permease
MERISRHYEIRLVAILCVTIGIVNCEMFGINYLMPFIEPALHLNNSQVGILGSAYWVAFALSSYLGGALADRLGKSKTVLQYTLVLFSVTSVLSGFATSFLGLLAARVVMGLLEGPAYLLPQSIIAAASPVERSGMNMGIVQNVGNLLSGVIAPLLLVALATHYNWRIGFFIIALPGLICAAMVAFFTREPVAHGTPAHGGEAPRPDGAAGLRGILRSRNIWLCVGGGCCFIGYITIIYGFLPLFLTQMRHFSPAQMSVIMSVLGVSGLVLGVTLPAVSDRTGRKPLMIVTGLMGVIVPLAAMFYLGPLTILAVFTFIGWALAGASPVIMATIPSESVPVRSISTAIGLLIAVSTLVGGVAGPALAGWSADRWSLAIPMWLAAGCCVIIAALSVALYETAPAKIKCVPIQIR